MVETLEQEQQWIDEDTAAVELADEVWEMLKRARLPIDRYKHPVLSADRERRLMRIHHDSILAKKELMDDLSRTQKRAAERRVEAGLPIARRAYAL